MLANVAVDSFFSVLRDSGLVVVTAIPIDTVSRPGSSERVRLYLRSDAGDSETIDLGPRLCGPPATAYDCTSLSILLKDGHRATDLQPVLASIPARLWLVSISGLLAGVRVFDRDRVDGAMRLLASQPAVRAVERDSPGWTDTPPLAAFAELSGALPLDFAQPVRGDGTLQSRPGDTLRVSYRQPDGTTLSSAMPVLR
jgi:hypothetical protein